MIDEDTCFVHATASCGASRIGRYTLAALVICGVGCQTADTARRQTQTTRAKIIREHGGLRRDSLASWKSSRIDDEHAFDYLLNRTAILWDGASQLRIRPDQANPEELRWVGVADDGPEIGQVSSAVAIAPDGYFLTAAHCVQSGRALLICPRGQRPPVEVEGKVIWSGAPIKNCDLAIVYAPTGEPIPIIDWSANTNVDVGQSVLVGGAGATSIRLAGGNIVHPNEKIEFGLNQPSEHFAANVPAISFLHQITIDAPLIPGDSGGPAILVNGSPIGIAIGTNSVGTPESVLISPDPFWLKEVVSKHREWVAQSPERSKPSARPSAEGFMRMQQQRRELSQLRASIE